MKTLGAICMLASLAVFLRGINLSPLDLLPLTAAILIAAYRTYEEICVRARVRKLLTNAEKGESEHIQALAKTLAQEGMKPARAIKKAAAQIARSQISDEQIAWKNEMRDRRRTRRKKRAAERTACVENTMQGMIQERMQNP